MRKCEFKKKYNPINCRHEKKHIYGEGVYDTVTNFLGRHIFNATAKKIAKDVTKKAASSALNKTGNYVGNKAGDKIIQLLQNKNNNESKKLVDQMLNNPATSTKQKKSTLSDYEINERVQRLLSGSGKVKKLKV